MRNRLLLGVVLLLVSGAASLAQTTAFTYQGKLADSGAPVTGNCDFEFRLFDTPNIGLQQGATLTLMNVAVSTGIFTVQLDFGVCPTCFNGAARFLEVAVKPSGGGSFATLSPRQPITSTPYAIKTQNLTFNGPFDDGISTVPTTNAFGGEGAGVNTTPDPILVSVVGKQNSFFGAGAGQSNIIGSQNAFFGYQAGQSSNSSSGAFFGYQAGQNTTGGFNAFFGHQAGQNTTGGFNAFLGYQAGQDSTGSSNAFFGYRAGQNTSGALNSFFGTFAGQRNTVGSHNTFIGFLSDFNSIDPIGDNNTGVGFATQINSGISNATAIGANAQVTQSNALVLGGISGINGATAGTNVGIGTTAPESALHVNGVNEILSTGAGAGIKFRNRGSASSNDDWNWYSQANIARFWRAGLGDIVAITASGNVGIGTTAPESALHVNGVNEILSTGAGAGIKFRNRGSASSNDDWNWYSQANIARFWRAGLGDIIAITASGNVGIGNINPNDKLNVNGSVSLLLASGGSTSVCQNVNFRLATCSSSIRYKENISSFKPGLSLINRLRPVSFNWKQSGMLDMGLVAEEVAEVEPLLVTHNDNGEVEGVKYDRIGIVLINAIREQQAQIKEQRAQIEEQQQAIETLKQRQQEFDSLRALVCADHPAADVCKLH